MATWVKGIEFIADEYDLKNDKVAKEFIFKTEDGLLNYNTGYCRNVIRIRFKMWYSLGIYRSWTSFL